MPKKSRHNKARKRARQARIAREGISQPREGNSQQTAQAVVEPVVSPKKKITEAQASAIRYQYVMPELRRIGILAGSMFLILLVLFFILG